MDAAAAYYHPPAPENHYPYYHLPPPPPQVHHAPPYALYAPPIVSSPAVRDEVRTLFVAGLPDDVRPREIYNLFREFAGYESSHLRSPNQSSQPFAFAVFLDQQSAIAAMHALNGMVFDLEKGSTLYIDLAKSNSRSKRQRSDNGSFGSEKRAKGSPFSRPITDSGDMRGIANSAHNIIGYPSAQSQMNFDTRAANETPASHLYIQRNNTPCPTLFVANLGASCTEHELVQVFSRCPGFIKLKMQGTCGAPVAFVDFQNTACSTGALSHLQGTVLYSSTGEGMRLEFAKSRMGMRKRN